MAESVDIVDVIKEALRSQMLSMHVHLPGKVATYDPIKNLADVLPMVKRPVPSAEDDDARKFEDLPTLPQIPVLWPRVGDFMMRGKLVKGDTGMLLFASSPWGEWLATGEVSEPLDVRKHSVGYAAFLPGFFTNVAQVTNAEPITGAMMTIGEHTPGGAAIGFKPGEIIAGEGGEALVKASAFADWASKVETALNSAGFPVSPLWNIGTNNATTMLKGK